MQHSQNTPGQQLSEQGMGLGEHFLCRPEESCLGAFPAAECGSAVGLIKPHEIPH